MRGPTLDDDDKELVLADYGEYRDEPTRRALNIDRSARTTGTLAYTDLLLIGAGVTKAMVRAHLDTSA